MEECFPQNHVPTPVHAGEGTDHTSEVLSLFHI